ncbi:MAG: hypothetical protein HF967_07965 [Methanosarcinales archaeon]|nr:hypothetical protein [Methanosarcinales archaeon]
MGFFDALFGRSKIPAPKSDNLFTMSTAYITLDASLNLTPIGAGICFKPMDVSKFKYAEREIQDLLYESCKETGTTHHTKKDEHGYLWVTLYDPDFEDLVTTLFMVSETLTDHDFGERLLCAVFKFKNEANSEVHWIYNFKRGTFYPFAPKGNKGRDESYEFRLKSIMEKELPIEKEMGKWYPMWGIPI